MKEAAVAEAPLLLLARKDTTRKQALTRHQIYQDFEQDQN